MELDPKLREFLEGQRIDDTLGRPKVLAENPQFLEQQVIETARAAIAKILTLRIALGHYASIAYELRRDYPDRVATFPGDVQTDLATLAGLIDPGLPTEELPDIPITIRDVGGPKPFEPQGE